MLSRFEMARLRIVKRTPTPEAIAEEGVLRSNASKGQQVSLYGFWRKEKKIPLESGRPSCQMAHRDSICEDCGDFYQGHIGHSCDGRNIGIFPGCIV